MGKSKLRRPDHYIDENGVVVSRSEVEGSRLQLVETVGTKRRPRPKVTQPQITRAPSTQSTVVVKCPQCGCEVSEQRLADHMSAKCPKRQHRAPDSRFLLRDDGRDIFGRLKQIAYRPRKKSEVSRQDSKLVVERPRPNSTLLVECPQCKCQVRESRLDNHMRLKCPKKDAPAQKQVENQVMPSREQAPMTSTPSSSRQVEALIQSDRESRFADKYVGQMRHQWDGKFGSLPLYDDYGDEADAD